MHRYARHGANRHLRYVHYNVLNYGNSANRASVKKPRLTTILQHVQADIILFNEIFSDSTLWDSLLLVLGNGWNKTAYSNQGGQTQTNTLFLRSSVFQLKSQSVISSSLRDIIGYHLQYRYTITQPHDTIAFTVIVCHLGAGQTSSDEMVGEYVFLRIHTMLGQQSLHTRAIVEHSVVRVELPVSAIQSGQVFFLTIINAEGTIGRSKLVKR